MRKLRLREMKELAQVTEPGNGKAKVSALKVWPQKSGPEGRSPPVTAASTPSRSTSRLDPAPLLGGWRGLRRLRPCPAPSLNLLCACSRASPGRPPSPPGLSPFTWTLEASGRIPSLFPLSPECPQSCHRITCAPGRDPCPRQQSCTHSARLLVPPSQP